MRKTHVDVTKTQPWPLLTVEESDDLSAGGIGSLQQAAEINHGGIIDAGQRIGIKRQVVVSHIPADIELRYTGSVKRDLNRSRWVTVIDLNVGRIEPILPGHGKERTPMLIIPHTADQPHRKPQLFQVKCKIKRGAAHSLIVRKNVNQHFANHNYHKSSPLWLQESMIGVFAPYHA